MNEIERRKRIDHLTRPLSERHKLQLLSEKESARPAITRLSRLLTFAAKSVNTLLSLRLSARTKQSRAGTSRTQAANVKAIWVCTMTDLEILRERAALALAKQTKPSRQDQLDELERDLRGFAVNGAHRFDQSEE